MSVVRYRGEEESRDRRVAPFSNGLRLRISFWWQGNLGRSFWGWVHWHNNERLHGFIGDIPPAEFEGKFYADNRQAHALAENTTPGSL